jgi:hypothetical protein
LSESEIEITIRPFVDTLDELRIPYQIGGSVASSVFGIARSTMAVDMVVAVNSNNVVPLAKRLESVYYISETAVKEAVERQSSFNLVHLETMMKIDVFILKDRSFDQEAFQRRRMDRLDSESSERTYYISSPEDIIINKLEWYNKGGRKSERQWNDIIGILKVQGNSLDLIYCEKWAKQLALGDLLRKALQDAGA